MKRRIALGVAVVVALVGGYQVLLLWQNSVRHSEPSGQASTLAPASSDPLDPAAVAGDPGVTASAAARFWAERLDHPPLDNFHRLDDTLYRGAQPDAAGMQALENLGIHTIINLRTAHDDDRGTRGMALRRENVRMIAVNVSEDEAVDFLRIVARKEQGPFFVHCQHGSDRTGAMCAVYRIVVQGWTVEEAIREMTQGGFGFHSVWKATILPDLRKLDYDRIRTRVRAPAEP